MKLVTALLVSMIEATLYFSIFDPKGQKIHTVGNEKTMWSCTRSSKG